MMAGDGVSDARAQEANILKVSSLNFVFVGILCIVRKPVASYICWSFALHMVLHLRTIFL